jgi:hypothetical protein
MMAIVEVPGLYDDGNIFAILGKATTALRRAGEEGKAYEMQERVLKSGGYDAALAIIQEYVTEEV